MERKRADLDLRCIKMALYGDLPMPNPFERNRDAIHDDADFVPSVMVVIQRQDQRVFDHDGIHTMKATS
jgi:hypothetical protein